MARDRAVRIGLDFIMGASVRCAVDLCKGWSQAGGIRWIPPGPVTAQQLTAQGASAQAGWPGRLQVQFFHQLSLASLTAPM